MPAAQPNGRSTPHRSTSPGGCYRGWTGRWSAGRASWNRVGSSWAWGQGMHHQPELCSRSAGWRLQHCQFYDVLRSIAMLQRRGEAGLEHRETGDDHTLPGSPPGRTPCACTIGPHLRHSTANTVCVSRQVPRSHLAGASRAARQITRGQVDLKIFFCFQAGACRCRS